MVRIHPKINTQQIVLVTGLSMIAQRTPSIGLRTLDDPGSNGIEIHIGQQIDQGSAVLNDQGFSSS
jgi:hypothetical protein